jgi:hypothetical protein
VKRAIALALVLSSIPLAARAEEPCIEEKCAAQGGHCHNNWCYVKLPTDWNCLEEIEAEDVPLHCSFAGCPGGVSSGGGESVTVNPTAEFGWLVTGINSLTSAQPAAGAYLSFRSYGPTSTSSVVPISIAKVTTTSLGRELTCDFSAVGATTHRVELYNGAALVLAVNAHSGVAARTGAWPVHMSFGKRGAVATQAWRYASPMTIQVPGTGSAVADQVVLISEGTTQIQWYESSDTPSAGLHDFGIQPDVPTEVPAAGTTTIAAAAAMLLAMGVVALRRRATPLTSS